MELVDLYLELNPKDEFNLSFFSDLHIGSDQFSKKNFKKTADERKKLKNSMFIGLGDTFDGIFANDKRAQSAGAGLDSKLHGSENLVGDTLSLAEEYLEGYPFKAFVLGNHEYVPTKSSSINLTEELCKRFNVPYCGYCGLIRVRCRIKGTNHTGTFKVLYSHGSWCSGNDAGYAAAMRWASAFQIDWDLFVYGHNHKMYARRVPMIRDSKAKISYFTSVVSATGAWYESFAKPGSKKTTYGEVKGHQATVIGCPLFRVKVKREGSMVNGRDVAFECDAIV